MAPVAGRRRGEHRSASRPTRRRSRATIDAAGRRLGGAAQGAGRRLPQPARRDERVARRRACRCYASATPPSCAQAAPVLQALAKLSEVKVFDDEAALAAATQAAPVAVVGDARLCLHMEIDVAAEKRAPGQGNRAPAKARSPRPTAKLANESFVATAPPAVIEQERTRVADFTAGAWTARLRDQRRAAPGAIVAPELAARCAGARRCSSSSMRCATAQAAAQARLARVRAEARRDLQRVDVVQRPARVERSRAPGCRTRPRPMRPSRQRAASAASSNRLRAADARPTPGSGLQCASSRSPKRPR